MHGPGPDRDRRRRDCRTSTGTTAGHSRASTSTPPGSRSATQFTLTRGIVAKAEPRRPTGWASIDHTIEHDASIQPGNSGGPLVATAGRRRQLRRRARRPTLAVLRDLSDLAQGRRPSWTTATSSRSASTARPSLDEEAGHRRRLGVGVAPGSPATGPAAAGRHRHHDERSAGRHRRHLAGLLRRDPHRRRRNPIASRCCATTPRRCSRRDQRRRPDRAGFSFAEEVSDEVGEDIGAAPVADYDQVTDDLNRIFMDVPTAWTARTRRRSSSRTGARRRTSPPRPTSTASSTGGRIRVSCTCRSRPGRTSTTC